MVEPILIAGPTASGKSRLAFEFARRIGGTIINADAMQVYAELSILTARPSASEMAVVPHRLYGHVPAAERYSVGLWLRDVAAALADTKHRGATPIIVGGSGLYLKALTEGLAAVPEVPATIRTAWRERAATHTTAALHALLAERSDSEAARIGASDRSRILRALEVLDATGRTLPEWQAEASDTALVDPERAMRIIVSKPRAELYAQINDRFLAMLEAGALDEAAAIAGLGLDEDLPAMKSIGLSALLAHLRGDLSLDDAIIRAQTDTRNYAKRQMTWFRNQMPDWPSLDPSEAALALSLVTT